MKHSKYYDGTKLLSLLDIFGKTPTLFFCVGNRTAGKTYFFKRMLLNRFRKKRKKFLILKRYNYEIQGTAEAFFKDIEEIERKFHGHIMTEKSFANGMMAELFYDGEPCGYVIAINQADLVKKMSTRFVDVEAIFFDEFQSETNKYCPQEVAKFRSILISIARGGGKQARHVPVYMCSNSVTVLNPYFVEYDIAKRLEKNTKFMRGNGWVLEQTYNESAAEALRREHAHMTGSKDLAYATGEMYLLDSEAFIEGVGGQKSPLLTIIHGQERYGVWHCKGGIVLINEKIDPSCKLVAAFNSQDHTVESQFLTKTSGIMRTLKQCYNEGSVRFSSQKAKNIFFDVIGLSLI